MRIYISSTKKDLEQHRCRVIEALQLTRHTPVCMEHHAADDAMPKDECLAEVAKCDLFVGIFAWRYGFIPEGCNCSITELEYRKAVECGIPTHAFLLQENAEWPDEFRDAGEAGERVRNLRRHLQEKKWVRFFESPDDLAIEVLAAVMAEMMRTEFKRARSATPGNQEQLLERIEQLVRPRAEIDQSAASRSVERLPASLPPKLVRHFQDRVTELATLRQCLANRNLRLVLICGRGGMGKSALVAKLCSELMAGHVGTKDADENAVEAVIYVPLGEAVYRSPDRIVELIARTLEPDANRELNDIWNQRGAPLDERLTGLLRGPLAHRRIVIVLDNLESVLDSENRIPAEYAPLRQFVDACVEHDHRMLIITTSRRALTLSPDAEVAAIGRRFQLSLDEGLPANFATALLRELDADGDLGFRDAQEDVLAHLVRRCHFIPRTLESLVGTLRGLATWTLETLLANEQFLSGLTEDPARELYNSLASDQQRLVMQALAVYDRPVPSAAVGFMLPALPVDELLSRLVRNLVVSHNRGQFCLHPLDRQHAYNQIPSNGTDYSRGALHKLAAEFCGRLCKTAEHWKTIDDLDPQLQQFHHLVHAGMHDEACRVLNEIDREHLSTWGHSQQIIELRTRLLGHIKERALEGVNLGNLGAAYLDSNDSVKAASRFEEALVIARETEQKESECRWLGNLGIASANLGNQQRAIDLITEALDLSRRIGNSCQEGRWLGNLTDICSRAGRIGVAQAVKDYQRAITISRQAGDWRFVMNWSCNMADLLFVQRELAAAKDAYLAALEAARRIGARRRTCLILLQLGGLHGELGDKQKEADYCRQARAILGEIHEPMDEIRALLRLASVQVELGQQQQRIQCLDEAWDLSRTLGKDANERQFLLLLGDYFGRSGDGSQQVGCYEHAVHAAHEAGDQDSKTSAVLRLAQALHNSGKPDAAEEQFQEALRLVRVTGKAGGEALVLYNYADALLNCGKVERAIDLLQSALPLVAVMNDKASLFAIYNRIGMARYLLGDPAGAIKAYSQALSVGRDVEDRGGQAIALFNIGDAHHMQGEVEEAIRCYESSLALDNAATNAKCALGLGLAHMQLGHGDQARAGFQKCADLNKGEPEMSGQFHPGGSALGLALLALDRPAEALSVFRKGLDLHPSIESLRYAIDDLKMLQRMPRQFTALDESIRLLEAAMDERSKQADRT